MRQDLRSEWHASIVMHDTHDRVAGGHLLALQPARRRPAPSLARRILAALGFRR